MTSKRCKLFCLFLTLCVSLLSACRFTDIPNKLPQPSLNLQEESQKDLLSWNIIPIKVRYNWIENNPEIQMMTFESASQAVECLVAMQETSTEEEGFLYKGIEALSYPKSYFSTHSLALLSLTVPIGSEYEIVGMQYDNEKLTVIIERVFPPLDTVQVAAFSSYCIFIEINEAIPASTDILLETQIKTHKI